MTSRELATADKTTVPTFCRVCEPQCGILATIEDGRITKVGSHRDHVSSLGHFCKKASAMIDITYDPDRLLYPMKSTGKPGKFIRITWEQALSEICEKITEVRDRFGKESVATFVGNPPAFAYATLLGANFFADTLGVKWRYSINAEDGASVYATNILLYGSTGVFAIPDIWRTHFLLVVGSNPLTSHGSVIAEPRIATALKRIPHRSGRVVVVDPRKTETARTFEHVPIQSGSDAWFLLAVIHEIIEQHLYDEAFVSQWTTGFAALKSAVRSFTPEWAEPHCGIPAGKIRELACAFGSAKSAAILSRTGTSTQRYGTLCTVLLHTLCILTANLDRAGGLSFGGPLIDFGKQAGPGTIGAVTARTTGLPEIGGVLPSNSLIQDILQPGEEQVRALIMTGANPALTTPSGGPELAAALQSLELFAAIDLYMNETNKFADYLLPSTAMFEREDIPLLSMMYMARPSLYGTKAVIEPQGEAREDWDIYDEICRRMGLGGALPNGFLRGLARLGVRITPKTLMDLQIRTSSVGDRFGLRPGGLNFNKLLDDKPDGVLLHEELPCGVIGNRLQTPDKRICLFTQAVESEVQRLTQDTFYDQPDRPLRMISMRQKSTHNSWMHNSQSLLKTHTEHALRIHPTDVEVRQIGEGDTVAIRSGYGEVSVKATLTEDMHQGNVALPHGWGHDGGWTRANAMGGVNSNIIASDSHEDSEKIAGMSVLNGIPVEVRRMPERPRSTSLAEKSISTFASVAHSFKPADPD